jgi:hypothetical protein
VITIDLAESEASHREQVREKLGEPYRTMLGHFRHEIGHYYEWQLIRGDDLMNRCRELFGDESKDYQAEIDRHYAEGPPAGWESSYISSYATMHPFEDFAETWAHYLHMVDGLETARAHGLSLRPDATGARATAAKRRNALAVDRLDLSDFDDLMKGWIPLTTALNSMNRSFGTADPYPFVLAPAAVDKLRFVHDLVEGATSDTRA